MVKTIITRSANDTLYGMAKALWRHDNNFVRCKQFPGVRGALDYLLYIFDNYSGWVVNADEDFFVINEDEIDNLILFMQDNNIVYAGMSDGGIISHRNNSPASMNPFFNIFNVDEIKKGLIHREPYGAEPFELMFKQLSYQHLHAKIDKHISTDGTSTVPIINGNKIGIHSWYSRFYEFDNLQTERINECYKYAFECRL